MGPMQQFNRTGEVSFRSTWAATKQTFLRWSSATSYSSSYSPDYFVKVTKTWKKLGFRDNKWKDKVALGLDATTQYDWENWKASSDKANYLSGERGNKFNPAAWDSRYIVDWVGNSRVFANGHTGSSTSLWTSADNLAKMRLLQAINKRRNQMLGGVTLLELKSTLTQLRKPYKALQSSIDNYLSDIKEGRRRLRKKYPRRPPITEIEKLRAARYRNRYYEEMEKLIRDSWLETSFGIKPTLMDLRDGVEAYARLMKEEEFNHVQVRGSATKEAASSAFYPAYQNIASFWITDATDTNKSVYGVTYKAGVAARFHRPDGHVSHDWAALFGFRPEDFVPTIWNVLPWSWCVDLFTNIGDIIEARHTVTDDVRWICRTQYATTHRIWQEDVNGRRTAEYQPSQPIIRTQGNRVGYCKSTYVSGNSRSVSPSSLVPEFEFTVPWASGNPVSTVNLIAALRGSLKGLQPFY